MNRPHSLLRRYFSSLLALGLIILSTISLILIILPRVFRWNWSTKYFFVSSLQLGSIGLLGLVPWLCFLLYASVGWHYRIIFFLIYIATIIFPEKNIILMYIDIKNSKNLLDYIYQESEDQYFYLQKNDAYLMEKKYKISIFPSAIYFLIFPLIAFATIPFAKSISVFLGFPYPHIFLGIFSIPINMMALAFVIKGWFVLIHLPKYATETKTTVYVDMSSKTKF